MLGFQVSTIMTNFICYLLRPYYMLALAERHALSRTQMMGIESRIA